MLKRIKKMILMGMIVTMMLFVTACHEEDKETTSSAETGDFSTEMPNESTDTKATGDVDLETGELIVPDILYQEDVLTDFWYTALTFLFADYQQYPEYHISVFADNTYSETDYELEADVYYNWNMQKKGILFDWHLLDDYGGDVTTGLDYYNSKTLDYSLQDDQGDRTNSEIIIEGYIGKTFSAEGSPYVEGGFSGWILRTAGEIYEQERGSIEGKLEAVIYVMKCTIVERQATCGFWVCLNGLDPMYVEANYVAVDANQVDYSYTITRPELPADVAETATMTMNVDLTTECSEDTGEQDSSAVIHRDEAERQTPSGNVDYNGDGFYNDFREGTMNKVFLTTAGEEELLIGYCGSDGYWIKLSDITGDDVQELILCRESGESKNNYYGIWQRENDVLTRLVTPNDDELQLAAQMTMIPLKIERINDTQLQVTSTDSQYVEIVDLEKELIDEFWHAKDGMAIGVTVQPGDNMYWDWDESAGEYRFYAQARIGAACLTGRILYRDGVWALSDVNIRVVERISEAKAEAEKAVDELQNELWLEVLEKALVQIREDTKEFTDMRQQNNYDRAVCIPWSQREDIEGKVIDVFHWETYRYNKPTRYEGAFVLRDREFYWSEKLEDRINSSEEEFDDLTAESNLVIDSDNEVELIGDPMRSDTDGYAKRCRAAEILIGAALRYAGERYLETVEAFETEMNALIYIIESEYDLDKPEAKVLIQMSGNDVPTLVEISYEGSCREEITDYTLTVVDTSQPFYEVNEALCFKTAITTTNNYRWLYTTWYAFEQFDEGFPYSGGKGVFAYDESEPKGNLLNIASDYDGDGLTDRVFTCMTEDYVQETYLFLSSGKQMLLYENRSWMTKFVETKAADLTGDGVAELIFVLNHSDNGNEAGWIQLFGVGEDGFDELPFVTEQGAYSGCYISIPLILKKAGENLTQITEPETGISFIAENTEDTFFNEGVVRDIPEMREQTVVCDRIEVGTDPITGEVILCIQGTVGAWMSGTSVKWEMRLIDDVWRVTDFSGK